MVKLNESLLEVSASAVAVIVGFASGPIGNPAGGLYFALKLGRPTSVSVPQAGLHGAPSEVSCHVTPSPTSFGTVAFTVTVGSPASKPENLFVIATETPGAPIVNRKLLKFVGAATEVAVITGCAAVPAGIVAGG